VDVSTAVESVLSSGGGVLLLRDVDASTIAAQRGAWDAVRVPGRRGGRLYAAAGAVLLIRCADQNSFPWVRVEVLDTAPAAEAPWRWEEPVTLDLTSGRLRLDTGAQLPPPGFLDIDAGAGPGAYAAVFGHTGRDEIRAAAPRITAQDSWDRLGATERYLIRLWPAG
jgi:hypothetical protein